MSKQIALLTLRYFPYKLSSLVAKKIRSKALAADWAIFDSAAEQAARRSALLSSENGLQQKNGSPGPMPAADLSVAKKFVK